MVRFGARHVHAAPRHLRSPPGGPPPGTRAAPHSAGSDGRAPCRWGLAPAAEHRPQAHAVAVCGVGTLTCVYWGHSCSPR